MVNLDEFVTVKQAARFLHVSANSLRNWHRDVKIPVYRNPLRVMQDQRSDVNVFRIGDVEVAIYIVGRTKEGCLAGVKTTTAGLLWWSFSRNRLQRSRRGSRPFRQVPLSIRL